MNARSSKPVPKCKGCGGPVVDPRRRKWCSELCREESMDAPIGKERAEAIRGTLEKIDGKWVHR